MERRGPQGGQHQVFRIGRNARHHAQRDDDRRGRASRGNQHDSPNQCLNQARAFRQADADHRHQNDADGAEVDEVRHHRRAYKADAVGRQQAVDSRPHVDDFMRLGVDALAGNAGAQHVEQLREDDDQRDQDEEQHGRVRDLVARTLDEIKQLLEERPQGLGRWRHQAVLSSQAREPLATLSPSPPQSRGRGDKKGAAFITGGALAGALHDFAFLQHRVDQSQPAADGEYIGQLQCLRVLVAHERRNGDRRDPTEAQRDEDHPE